MDDDNIVEYDQKVTRRLANGQIKNYTYKRVYKCNGAQGRMAHKSACRVLITNMTKAIRESPALYQMMSRAYEKAQKRLTKILERQRQLDEEEKARLEEDLSEPEDADEDPDVESGNDSD